MGNTCNSDDNVELQHDSPIFRHNVLFSHQLRVQTDSGQSFSGDALLDDIFQNRADSKPYQTFLQALIQEKKRFKDSMFSPNQNSIVRNQRLFEHYPKLLVHQKTPLTGDDVHLGNPDDQHFRSSTYNVGLVLMGLSYHYPDILKPTLLTKNNKVGFHVIRLFVNGQQRDVVIDDLVPFVKGFPLHLKSKNTLWPLLIQKAWAKLHSKGYGSERQVLPSDLIQELVGLPTQVFKVSKECLRQDRCQFISSKEFKTRRPIFYIKNNFEVTRSDGTHQRLYQLLSPVLAVHEKSLALSAQYSQLIAKHFNTDAHGIAGLNIFSQSDLLNNFEYIFSCQRKPGFVFNSLPLQGSPVYVRVKVLKPSRLNLRVFQCYHQYVQGQYRYSNDDFQIYQESTKTYMHNPQYTIEGHKSQNLFAKHQTVSPGTYLLSCRFNWLYSHTKFNLLAYSDHPVEMSRVDEEEGLHIIARCIINNIKEEKLIKNNEIAYINQWKNSKGYIYVRNEKSKYQDVSIKISGCKNVVFMGHSKPQTFKALTLRIQKKEDYLLIYDQYNLSQPANIQNLKIQI